MQCLTHDSKGGRLKCGKRELFARDSGAVLACARRYLGSVTLYVFFWACLCAHVSTFALRVKGKAVAEHVEDPARATW